jgi:hypothetical protein
MACILQRPVVKPSSYTFTVTEDDADFILNALAEKPYNVVAKLIINLQQQAQVQLAAANPPPPSGPAAIVE